MRLGVQVPSRLLRYDHSNPFSAPPDIRTPDPDPDEPRNPHASHTWVHRDRWCECSVCRVRDHWRGASRPCRREAKDVGGVPLGTALETFHADLLLFGEWWTRKALEDRPTLEDWLAEFAEWRRVGSGSGQ